MEVQGEVKGLGEWVGSRIRELCSVTNGVDENLMAFSSGSAMWRGQRMIGLQIESMYVVAHWVTSEKDGLIR